MMNEQTLRDGIRGVFEEMDESDVIYYWNEYCRNNSCWEDYIYYQSDFNDKCAGLSPLEIVELANGADINSYAYFWETIYGIEVGDSLEELPVDIDTLIDYCIDSYKSFGISRIDKLFDDFFYQDDESED